jgi:antibiotic biosynthesis monooxygenase (ABM) superfamily enzyme
MEGRNGVPTQNVTDNAVTVIIGQSVRRETEQQFLAWQHDLNEAASRYPGFVAAEVAAPTEAQPDWVVIYRFDSLANLRGWLNSSTRQERLATGAEYFAGPPTQQIVGGAAKPADQLVTVVATHRVAPEDAQEFLEWQEQLRLAESKFDGYRGTELFRPVDGVQDEWTAMYRYDNVADLEAWLTSDERTRLLDEGKKFNDFELRTVDNSFGSWFAFDDKGNQAPPPSDVKTSFAVWVGIYPTAMTIMLCLSPLELPLWLGTLVGNLFSSFILTYVTMPYYANRLLKRFLWPSTDEPPSRTNLRAAVIVVASLMFWAVFFYLITTKFWGLPWAP